MDVPVHDFLAEFDIDWDAIGALMRCTSDAKSDELAGDDPGSALSRAWAKGAQGLGFSRSGERIHSLFLPLGPPLPLALTPIPAQPEFRSSVQPDFGVLTQPSAELLSGERVQKRSVPPDLFPRATGLRRGCGEGGIY